MAYCDNPKCTNYGCETEIQETHHETRETPAEYGTECCGTEHWTQERDAGQREAFLASHGCKDFHELSMINDSIDVHLEYQREMDRELEAMDEECCVQSVQDMRDRGEFDRLQQLEMEHGGIS